MQHSTSPDRPIIPSAVVGDETGALEAFQNATLRPIIKLLHPIILLHFCNYLKIKRNIYFKLSEKDQAAYIVKVFQSDTAYKTELRGLVMGHFKPLEFETYLTIKEEVHRRINKIILERLLNSHDQFVKQ